MQAKLHHQVLLKSPETIGKHTNHRDAKSILKHIHTEHTGTNEICSESQKRMASKT
jgi:hypothetical protein